MTYNELMGKVGEMLELEEFEPDADGMCMLLGEEAAVFFQHLPEADLVLTTATVCELEDEPDPAFLRRLLEANLMWQETKGSTLALDAAAKSVVLARYDRVSALDPERFVLTLDDFLTTLAKWGEWDRTRPPVGELSEDGGAPASSSADVRTAVMAGAIRV